MIDFGRIVYLDLQKTGSSYVTEFLRFACKFPVLKYRQHLPVGDDYRFNARYFITIRNPYSLYSSLYRFGLDGKGTVFKRLEKAGLVSAYSSLETFTECLMKPDNANLLDRYYSPEIASEIGFMSFRFLILSLKHPFRQIKQAAKRKTPYRDLIKNSIVDHVLKNESLNEDLLRLSSELFPDCFDMDRAKEFLFNVKSLNRSSRSPTEFELNSRELRKEIESKEALILNHYR